MKKFLLITALFGLIYGSSFSQSQKLNRTNTRKSETKDTVKRVLPTIDRTPAGTGAPGIDGTINDKNSSGVNRSSSFTTDSTSTR